MALKNDQSVNEGENAKARKRLYGIVFGDCLLIYVDRSGLIVHEGHAIIRCLWQANLAV